ncbi:MAG: LicD family protein [Clostridia bacterium]|nr:LicD family protein [Clostridia bacterium]
MDLKEEVVCGFTVSSNRKKVWRTELDMVHAALDICGKYGLKIFAIGGTLIGAVRHGGFIPWDDDIDLFMPRTDYEKFIAAAKTELKAPYFLQHYTTEKAYPNGHAQIRNSQTTCFINESYSDLKRGKNCGIFIDIFPYDNLPDDKPARTEFWKKIKRLKNLVMWKIYPTEKSLKGFVQKCVATAYFCFHGLENTIKKADMLSRKFNGKTEKIAPVSFGLVKESTVWNEKDAEKIICVKFEDTVMPIPENYDQILKTQYGDYMKIPEDKGGSMHGTAFFDTEKPYMEYRGVSKKDFRKLLARGL